MTQKHKRSKVPFLLQRPGEHIGVLVLNQNRIDIAAFLAHAMYHYEVPIELVNEAYKIVEESH